SSSPTPPACVPSLAEPAFGREVSDGHCCFSPPSAAERPQGILQRFAHCNDHDGEVRKCLKNEEHKQGEWERKRLVRLDPRTPGSRPELKADAQRLRHPGAPL
uniref:COX assembly mitochondrial protein n=1 Tax=Ailuropoda melanoleuca TaxID=9646 RepID=A0A7N5JNE7_AILME